MTLISYDIFKPVNRKLSLLAVSFAFVGLTFEALRLQPQGLNLALVFHGFYSILVGYSNLPCWSSVSLHCFVTKLS